MSDEIRIGLVGTGFGRRVVLPAFAACQGSRVAAVCSRRRENAEAAAEAFRIPGIYTDYEAMLDREALDLVVITTPPHLHGPMTRAALERKLHVLCEKPMALDLGEARRMEEMARQSGTLAFINHELRFNPALGRLQELVNEGYLGRPETVSFHIRWSYPMDRGRPWGWWFDRDKGGGLLGALGSHQIDLLRWMTGEFVRVKGHLHTFVRRRRLPDSEETRDVTSDDYCAFSGELEGGALGTVTLDATARVRSDRDRWRVALHGESGSLVFEGDGRLWGLKQDGAPEELAISGTVDVPGLPEGQFPLSFARFSQRLVDALQRNETVAGAATFSDGMHVQAVLDAVRRSHERGGWEDVQRSGS